MFKHENKNLAEVSKTVFWYVTVHHKPHIKSPSLSGTICHSKTKENKRFSVFIGGKQLKCHYLLQKSFTFFSFCSIEGELHP